MVDWNVFSIDGKDFCFISVEVQDVDGCFVFIVDLMIDFSVEGLGEVVVIDNGDFNNMIIFFLFLCKVFNGWVLVIVWVNKGSSGIFIVIV